MHVQMDRLVGGRRMNIWIIRPEFQLVLLASSSHILPFWSQFLLVLVNHFVRGWLSWTLAHWANKVYKSQEIWLLVPENWMGPFLSPSTNSFKIIGLCSLSFKVRSEYMKKLFEDTRAIYSYNFEIISKLYNMFIPSMVCVSCMNLEKINIIQKSCATIVFTTEIRQKFLKECNLCSSSIKIR